MFTSSRYPHAALLAAALLLGSAGCKKALDLEPLDTLSDAAYWKTPNDFLLAANQFYTYERSFVDVIYNADGGKERYHADQKSDLVNAQNPYSRGQNALQASDANYNDSYSRIRNINYLLDRAQTYTTPADIAKYVGEAKFFRAYVYFDLLQTYGGVPLVKTQLAPTSADLQNPRDTRDEVIDFILQDLTEALATVPAKTGQPATELGRINKEVVLAFRSRVALYEGTWQKSRGNTSRGDAMLDQAITASNAVITGAQYQLFAPAILGDSAQKYMFILENQKSNPASLNKSANNEYILANRYDQTVRQIRFNISRQALTLIPTKNFVNLYLSNDGLPIDKSPRFQGYATLNSEFINRDNRMRYTIKRAGGYYWFGILNPRVDWTGGPADRATAYGSPFVPYANSTTGYTQQKWVAERGVADNEEGYDFPVIRYAEVLLTYAEAKFERDGSISDADLDKSLNLVRNRVNKTMPKLSNALVSGNGLDMRTEIRRERTIEFFAEGFRLDDLKRWNTAVAVLGQPLLGIKWTGTAFQTLWPSQANTPKDANGNLIVDNARSFAARNYLVPLPTQQLILNPNLTQNPGW